MIGNNNHIIILTFFKTSSTTVLRDIKGIIELLTSENVCIGWVLGPACGPAYSNSLIISIGSPLNPASSNSSTTCENIMLVIQAVSSTT